MWITSRSRARFPGRFLIPLALTVPLAVAVEVPEDSTVTELRVAAGTGTYLSVVRDCEGRITDSEPVDFADIGVSLERLSGKWGFGIHAGYLDDARVYFDYTNTYPPENRTTDAGYYYLSPDLQLSTRKVGATLGFLYTTEGLPVDDGDYDAESRSGAHVYPTMSLRFGNPASLYVSTHVFSMLPVYSGGDYATIGIGGLMGERVRLWAGIGSGGLYSDSGLVFQGDVQLGQAMFVGFNTRYGDEDNYGVGLSLAHRWSGGH